MESSSSKATQKKQDVTENSKQPDKNDGEALTNSEGKKGSGNSSKLSTSSECQLGVPKQKQQGKTSRKSKSISQDNPVEEGSTVKKPTIQMAKSSGKGTSSSDALAQNGECEQHRIPKKPGFALKRSAASTDVRVALDEDGLARKKSLPKLVKTTFKAPTATKGDKNGKAPAKMPKLLKPSFVSPTLSKPENNHDVRKEVCERRSAQKCSTLRCFRAENCSQEKSVAEKKSTMQGSMFCR